MNIRILRQEDIKQCVDIVGLNYNNKFDKIDIELNSMFIENSWLKPTYLVIEEDDKIVSFGGFCESCIDYNCFEIFWINTHPNYINKGYATAIVNEIINTLRKKGIKNLYIILSCKNELKKFYKKIGFKKAMKRPSNGYLMSIKI